MCCLSCPVRGTWLQQRQQTQPGLQLHELAQADTQDGEEQASRRGVGSLVHMLLATALPTEPSHQGPHQGKCLCQLVQGLLCPLPGVLQLAQRVFIGPLAQPLRQGAQTHEVALLLALLGHRGDVETLKGCGEAGCDGEAGEAW